MTYFTGIDVSLRSVTICIVDQEGKVCHEAKTPARPDAIAQALKEFSADARRVGLESGTLTQYLTYGLQASGCMESRQVKNTLASMRNKTDLPLGRCRSRGRCLTLPLILLEGIANELIEV